MRLLRARAKRPAAPAERSRTQRVLSALAALPPIVALAWVGFLWMPALIALIGLAAGHYYSGRMAGWPKAPRLGRALIFCALHLALIWMCAGLFLGSPLPQAQFALYALAITSFDLRTRGNLMASLGIGVMVLYVAATLARDYGLVLFALAFTGLALAVFYQAEIDSARQGATATARPLSDNEPAARQSRGVAAKLMSGLGVGGLLAAFVVFAFTPHFASRPIIPPFSLDLPIPRGVTAQVVNPALPLVQINGWSNQKGDYYYGFDARLDLTYRGGLADDVVLYVRSPAWSYWRSHSYDTYTGSAWEQRDTALTELAQDQRQIYFQIPVDNQALGDEIVQSFYLVRDQPNLVFAAYRPVEAYLNTRALALDAGDGLRVGEPMPAGTTYTIVSRRPNFTVAALRASKGALPADVGRKYLPLPGNLSARVRALAAELTANAPTSYDKAAALRDYLLTIPYDYYPPPQPPGSETVDNFVFVDKRGVCEQFATSLAVMLRVLGIPARLVAGYGAGQYNSLSGYYTVRASDAHAWVEAYFPGYGWVPFDPTPGWTPSPYTAPVQQWLFSSALKGLPALPLGDLAAAGAALMGAASVPLFFIFAALVLVLAGWLFWLGWRQLRRQRPVGFAAIDGDVNRRRILAAYRAGQRRLKRFRGPAETPSEFARRVGQADWDQVTQAAEQAAYRPQPPAPPLAQRVQKLVSRLKPYSKP